MKDLVVPKNLEDLCKARNKAIGLYEASYKTIKSIEADLEGIYKYLFPYGAEPKINPADFKKYLDKGLWQFSFTKIGFHQFLDAKAKEDMDKDLEKSVPEFTVENVKETLLTAAQNADKMFARGIVNVFHSLSKEHKTNRNSPFKINPKAILRYYAAPNWTSGLRLNCYGTYCEHINDIDRVIKTLDGKKHQPRELEGLINGAWAEKPYIFEDEYYRIRGHKNGNIHIEFKRQDLLDKANIIIARYYGGNNLVS